MIASIRKTPPLLWILLATVAARAALYDFNYGPDGKRFVRQAHEIVAGEGFTSIGQPTTNVPPGYPLILIPAFFIHDDPVSAIWLNFVLSIGAVVLAYAAVRPQSK